MDNGDPLSMLANPWKQRLRPLRKLSKEEPTEHCSLLPLLVTSPLLTSVSSSDGLPLTLHCCSCVPSFLFRNLPRTRVHDNPTQKESLNDCAPFRQY